ncbi:uncharacterized protein LOC127858961 [Dreissena polymorpha]|uniref:Uncharacterized protein n=1 Tax=Dreissena polymorpha TaxID=45954 RepID=A0A9D3Z1W3_DREPO|nr:uncharacterized protein LOC127858961 [Dreissena polymorpha]XP_052252287.1 uncharacterized protein LOC127858961 [Dreissena polymorpha]XP_052252288.1 uncharacterized protein LOC127858961 [Dreissena polymorpha]XP_052252289.1 uncharacterized protein LOC127858961 [Dreissena polymorpha]XP_052252290.1 uncharacterized protein LOC127858961 [Dreissena polymorpha]KAH3711405.1 hypothetical protein DPMN_071074 [Dreissena polymorpha]
MASGSHEEDVTCFKYACSAYPKYKYASQYVRPLIIKCKGLLRKCGIKDDRFIPDFQTVTLAVQGSSHAPFLNQCSHTVTGDECLSSCPLLAYQTGKTEEGDRNPLIYVATYHSVRMSDKRANLLGDCVILINKNLESDEHNGVIHVTTQDSFSALVSTLLEELVFRWLKGLVKVMVVLDTIRLQFQSVDRSDFESQLLVTLTDMFENCSGRNGFQVSETLQGLLGIGGFSSHDECMTAHAGLVEANKLLIKDTIFEAIAMYKRRRHQNEDWLDAWPTIDWSPVKITDEVCDAVRKVDGAIECGIRYGTFCVYVKNTTQSSDEEIAKQLMPQLRQNGIQECTVLRQVHENPLAAQCSTGSKIHAMGHGTLGGFAMKNESMLALLAKHVVGEENDVYIVDENEYHRIGPILKPTVDLNLPAPLDIAAALVIIEIPEKRFKDTDGRPSISKLFNFDQGDTSFLESLPVYIWGASSKPGYGKITTCDSKTVKGMNNIVIEDITIEYYESADEFKPFAKPGDSGSIICSENPEGNCIDVIGMLMGERVIKDPSNQKKQYLAFPLQHGLRQLAMEQNQADGHIRLYEDS